jgi:NitT/TauT family transport system substrate-binding protein
MFEKFAFAAARAAVIAGAALAAFSAQAAPDEVTYLLPAPPTLPAFGPWMIAQQNGYYAAENLKVTFVAGKGGVDVAKQVGAGNAPVGGAIGDTPIIVRANGVPVRAVAVLGGGSLTQLAVHEASPIKTVKDLKGKTLTVMAYTDTTRCSARCARWASAATTSRRRPPARRACGSSSPPTSPRRWPRCPTG